MMEYWNIGMMVEKGREHTNNAPFQLLVTTNNQGREAMAPFGRAGRSAKKSA
jgi:hypothetical protein